MLADITLHYTLALGLGTAVRMMPSRVGDERGAFVFDAGIVLHAGGSDGTGVNQPLHALCHARPADVLRAADVHVQEKLARSPIAHHTGQVIDDVHTHDCLADGPVIAHIAVGQFYTQAAQTTQVAGGTHQDAQVIPSSDQPLHQVAANEPCRAGYEDFHGCNRF